MNFSSSLILTSTARPFAIWLSLTCLAQTRVGLRGVLLFGLCLVALTASSTITFTWETANAMDYMFVPSLGCFQRSNRASSSFCCRSTLFVTLQVQQDGNLRV